MKFVWSETSRFVAGGGGTENHTLERARQLQRQGFPVEIVFISNGTYDPGFSDIPFSFLPDPHQLSKINDTIIYIARGHDVETIKPSFIFLHFPMTHASQQAQALFLRATHRSKLITNSQFSKKYWAHTLGVNESDIVVVYPFAHPVFATVPVYRETKPCRVLYPNRITPEKGLFVFLEAAYILGDRQKYNFTVTGAGNQTEHGQQTEVWLRKMSQITYLPPISTRIEMAQLFANTNLVIVPSRNDYWEEPFGMISVEGQHSGCRVVASDSGGLPETNCGLLDIIESGNAFKLAQKIEELSKLQPVTVNERALAAKRFTLKQSVDSFLMAIS